jgi:hypothetical protein
LTIDLIPNESTPFGVENPQNQTLNKADNINVMLICEKFEKNV